MIASLLTLSLFSLNADDKSSLEALIIKCGGDTRTHDPTIVKEGETYYRFQTGPGVPISTSKDLKYWKPTGRVFKQNPDWTKTTIPGSTDFWAPEVVFMEGQWRVYYSISTFGSNRSAIGLVTNKTLDKKNPEYAWIDQGMVINSIPQDDFNAIDAFVAQDNSGQAWLGFGSFWGGIKIRKLDKGSGKLPLEGSEIISLASRNLQPNTIEGGYILHKGKYFYLFVSWDFCCRGLDSTYRMAVGRSEEITGPYVDHDGKLMLEGGGTVIRKGDRWDAGVGHNSVLIDGDKEYLVFHGYDKQDNGASKLRIEQIVWSTDDWPQSPQQLLNQIK